MPMTPEGHGTSADERSQGIQPRECDIPSHGLRCWEGCGVGATQVSSRLGGRLRASSLPDSGVAVTGHFTQWLEEQTRRCLQKGTFHNFYCCEQVFLSTHVTKRRGEVRDADWGQGADRQEWVDGSGPCVARQTDRKPAHSSCVLGCLSKHAN